MTAGPVHADFAGPLIYLSAAMPEPEEQAAGAEEAIVSLARAAYAELGGLLINEDEDILTLVALVAGEYTSLEPEEEPDEQRPRPPEREPQGVRPQPPLIVLPRRAYTPESGAVEELVRFGYLARCHPEERFTLLRRAAAMVCIGPQDEADWRDFIRSSERPRPVVALRSTGATAPPGSETDFEGVLRIAEERFLSWMAERRRLELGDFPEQPGPWAEFEEPLLPGTSYPVLMQLLVERLRGEG